MGCFTWLVLMGGSVFVMMTLLRWFEQTAEAVDLRWWNKTSLLVLMPFAVWLFPSRVSAGRPSPVPLHEPVRGFGSLPKAPPAASDQPDQPPPGTPKAFLETPQIPPPKSKNPRPPVDADKIARLRQKLREQGMLDEEGK